MDHVVNREWQESKGLRETKAPLVLLVPRVPRASRVRAEARVQVGQPEQRVQPVPQALVGLLGLLGVREHRVLRERLGLPVIPGLPVQQELRVRRGNKGLLERLVRREHRARPGLPVRPGPRGVRERMEQHRANPVCASCHAPMDPFGFALENFDATGRWRDTDGGAAIDVTTTLADGGTIDGPAGLHEHLLSRRDEFLRTVTEKLLSYALGRSLEYYDAPAVRQIVRDAARDDYRWSSLVLGVVRSVPFQMRRVADPGASASSTVAQRP